MVTSKTEYIENMNFDGIRDHLFSVGCPTTECKEAIRKYRMFLRLKVKFNGTSQDLIPAGGIGAIWHHHILDTVQYTQDCEFLFGAYFHYIPPFTQAFTPTDFKQDIDRMVTNFLFRNEYGESMETKLYENS